MVAPSYYHVVSEVDEGEHGRAYIGHDVFPEVGVGVLPSVAVRDYVVGTCCAEFCDHQGGCSCRHDNSAV